MSDKMKSIVAIAVSLAALSGCSFWNRSLPEVVSDPLNRAGQTEEIAKPQEEKTEPAPAATQQQQPVSKNVEMVPLNTPRAIVVCRSKQCAPLKLSMSKEYIYNSLVAMMENNNRERALLCAADAGSHSCYQNYVSLPITVGMTPAYMYIDSAKISDFNIAKKSPSATLMINYNVTYNGQTPDCAPSQTTMYVKNTNNIVMQDNGYRCKMTTIGSTSVKTLFMVDYIDLDYGFIGGYYSIGLSGPAYGGGTGYMMLRLSKTDYKQLPAPAIEETPDAATPADNAPKAPQGSAMEGQRRNGAPADAAAAESDGAVQVFPIRNKK